MPPPLDSPVLRDGLTRLTVSREGGRDTAWLAAVPADAFPHLEAHASDWLSPAERAYLSRLEVSRRRQSYLLGRVAAKRAVGHFLETADPTAVTVDRGVFGQPVVRAAGPDVPGVSISHTDRWAVALTHPVGHPMAVDVETVSPERETTVRTHLTPAEAGLLDTSVGPVVLWAMKEALGKVLRCGLTVPLDVLAVGGIGREPDGRAAGTFRHFLQYRAVAWEEDGHAVAVVLPRATALAMTPH